VTYAVLRYKTCPKCKRGKILKFFALDPKRKDGLDSYCKQCRKYAARKRRERGGGRQPSGHNG
jgi:hypothetical protein